MSYKNTDDLNQELMSACDLDSFLSQNENNFETVNVQDALNEIFKEKNISKAELAARAHVSEVYLHQIFSGRRTPTRDKVLCLCIALAATLDETQGILKKSGYAQLYTRVRREAIIMHGIINGDSVSNINDKLKENGEFLLF